MVSWGYLSSCSNSLKRLSLIIPSCSFHFQKCFVFKNYSKHDFELSPFYNNEASNLNSITAAEWNFHERTNCLSAFDSEKRSALFCSLLILETMSTFHLKKMDGGWHWPGLSPCSLKFWRRPTPGSEECSIYPSRRLSPWKLRWNLPLKYGDLRRLLLLWIFGTDGRAVRPRPFDGERKKSQRSPDGTWIGSLYCYWRNWRVSVVWT